MAIYNLQLWNDCIEITNGSYTLNKNRPIYTFDVTGGMTGIKKVAYGKIPDGHYKVFSKTGKDLIYTVRISAITKKNAEKKRPQMSKDQYDQLYYYIEGDVADYHVFKMGKSPLNFTSPRRYDTLNEARKGALAKSYKIFRENKVAREYGWKQHSFAVYVYKGTRFVGVVTYDWMKHYDGLWASAEHIKDPQPLNKDGSIR